MSWLGKILAVVAMVLAVVWMALTASVYSNRVNWKVRSDQLEKAYADAKTAREGEYRVYLAEKDALAKQLAAAESKGAGLASQVVTLKDADTKNTAQIAALNASIKDADIKAADLQSNFQASLAELDAVRKRSATLEEEKIRLTVAKEDAEKGRLAAEIAQRQAQAARLLAEAEIERLRGDLARAQEPGGRAGGPSFAPPVRPVPEGLRGTVEAVAGGTLVLSVGDDAGLSVGAEVDVFRTGTDARYLGRAVVTRVEPKMAAATFRPASGRPLAQLRAEEQPKKGDGVGKVGAR